MPGHFADGTPVNTVVGATDHGRMLLDESPEPQPQPQPRRLLSPQMTQQHMRAPRQRPSQASSQPLTVASPAPRRGSRLVPFMAGVETLVRKLSRQRLQSPEVSPSTDGHEPQPASPSAPSPSITQTLTPSPSPSPGISRPERHLPGSPPDVLHIGIDLQSVPPVIPRAQDLAGKRYPSIDVYPKSARPVVIEGPILEPDPDCDSMDISYHNTHTYPLMLNTVPAYIEPAGEEIAVDQDYLNGSKTVEDQAALIERFRARRRAGTPSGSGRRMVDGIPLRYRLSSEAALRCQNLVLSKPRMRKRKKPSERRNSVAPSETATVNSTTSSMSISIPAGSTVSRPLMDAQL
ncbi:hypothetical protein B0T16DRAFT_459302 [Cercophora newfieldiana]|uniref:Uncharacterized protein n=1 Tax=Cercophora newfieldiana TaxID=92897 RepID=A0AA39Y234_9PEZI|nr:hypothetical protein B0T16DRAFT_459302 [Cercophora newfieldiana]